MVAHRSESSEEDGQQGHNDQAAVGDRHPFGRRRDAFGDVLGSASRWIPRRRRRIHQDIRLVRCFRRRHPSLTDVYDD